VFRNPEQRVRSSQNPSTDSEHTPQARSLSAPNNLEQSRAQQGRIDYNNTTLKWVPVLRVNSKRKAAGNIADGFTHVLVGVLVSLEDQDVVCCRVITDLEVQCF
jgi:hypothetical protein